MDTPLALPLAASQVLASGGRVVGRLPPGRGHADNDLLLGLPDAALMIGGGLVEQSGPPAFGSDSFPLDWPATLEALATLTPEDTTYVPGHGDPAGRGFLREMQEFVSAVAEQIRVLHADGVPAQDAVRAGSWPIADSAHFAEAVQRGYAQLSGALP